MRNPSLRLCLALSSLFLTLAVPTLAATAADFDQAGKPPLESIGPIAFAPDGTLFAGDSIGAAVFALESADDATPASKIDVADIGSKIAALVGTTADSIQIHDLAVHPSSRRAYLSVTRGQGDEAIPLVVRVSAGERIEVLDLDDIRYSRAELPNAPDPEDKDRRGRSRRVETITDLAFVDGQVLVTGLSNEEFSSKLRKLDFPFREIGAGTSVEIFHGAHGRWETNAPVRTLTTYEVESEPKVLAAYTCTPLVTFPLSAMVDAVKVTGTTVAELGNRNRPIDMVVYEKDGHDYLLMANSSRGVMKVDLTEIEGHQITERINGTAGLQYQTMTDWQGVQQLDRFDEDNALILVGDGEELALKTVALP